MPKTTPKTARGLGRISYFLRHRLLRGPKWAALAVVLVAGAACGTGSISFPGVLGQAGGNTSGQTTGTGTTPPASTPPAANATGLSVGFEYAEGSASASAHSISDTSYWSSVLQNLTAQATGSVPAARLVVGTWNAGKVDLMFPQGSGGKIANASFRQSDIFSAILTVLDAANANVILEVQPGTASPTGLVQAILEQYATHTSVVGLSFDLAQYGGNLGKTLLTDSDAKKIIQAAKNYGGNLQVQVRHSDARYFPSSSISELTFVLDTDGTGSEMGIKSKAQGFSGAYSGVKIGFIIGSQNDKSWACKLSGPGQLIGDVAGGGSNISGIFWSTQTVSQLAPTNTFACFDPTTDPNTSANNPNTGGGANPNTSMGENPNKGTGTNPNSPMSSDPNTDTPTTPTTNPNVSTTNPNSAAANPSNLPQGSNGASSSPNDKASTDSNSRGGGLFGF